MKRILITGENSYIGKNFQTWLMKYPEKYEVESISVRGENWKEKDFSKFDVVYHVAGIAHIKETKANRQLYYQVNRDLAVQVAKKSKDEGVKQFIFLSSMSVYGLDEGVITKNTPLIPKNAYGQSKLDAERKINILSSIDFNVLIVRPPMVYGKNCKGNYSRLAKLSKAIKFFPKVNNKRSMIFIDNLSEIIKISIDENVSGILFPQNKEYINTSTLVSEIARANRKKIVLIDGLSLFLKITKKNKIYKKIFGTLIYDERIINFIDIPSVSYSEIGFLESIVKTES